MRASDPVREITFVHGFGPRHWGILGIVIVLFVGPVLLLFVKPPRHVCA